MRAREEVPSVGERLRRREWALGEEGLPLPHRRGGDEPAAASLDGDARHAGVSPEARREDRPREVKGVGVGGGGGRGARVRGATAAARTRALLTRR